MTASRSATGAIGIGALSRATGCKVETIRYYERSGLLPPPRRTTGGHRVYGDATLKRLNFIRRSRRLGFSLADIRRLLELADARGSSCEAVYAMTVEHMSEVTRKIADLQKLQQALEDIAGRCRAGAVPECPIIEALYEPLEGCER